MHHVDSKLPKPSAEVDNVLDNTELDRCGWNNIH